VIWHFQESDLVRITSDLDDLALGGTWGFELGDTLGFELSSVVPNH